MKSRKRSQKKGDVVSTDQVFHEAIAAKKKMFLSKQIVHTRDVANGMDFLFSGPRATIIECIMYLQQYIRSTESGLNLTYVDIDDYVLLRITGNPSMEREIHGFLTSG